MANHHLQIITGGDVEYFYDCSDLTLSDLDSAELRLFRVNAIQVAVIS